MMYTLKLWRYSLLLVCSVVLGSCTSKEPPEETPRFGYRTPIQADRLKQDLNFLFTTIQDVHPNMYAFISEEDFTKFREHLYTQISHHMTKLEFYKLLAPVVASLRSGHTFIFPPLEDFDEYTKAGGRIFPLSLSWDGQQPILIQNLTPNWLPIGGSILAINEEDAVLLVRQFASYFPSENKDSFPWQLGRDELLRFCIWLHFGPVASLDVRTKAIDGTVRNYSVELMALDQIEDYEDHDKAKNSYSYLAQYDTYLVKLNEWASTAEMKKFCEEVFGKIKDDNATNLIIDVRTNPGGNSSSAEDFVQYIMDKPYYLFEEAQAKLSKQFCDRYGVRVSEEMIGTMFTKKGSLIQPQPNPLRFDGQIYVLIGVRSTSTTTAFAAAIKRFRIGALIGEETADPTTVYGNAFDFRLPNSGLHCFCACQIYTLAGSKNDGRGVLPDYEVIQNPKDTAKGIDTALQFTLDLMTRSQAIE